MNGTQKANAITCPSISSCHKGDGILGNLRVGGPLMERSKDGSLQALIFKAVRNAADDAPGLVDNIPRTDDVARGCHDAGSKRQKRL